MRGKNRRTVIVLLSTVVFVAGCGSSSALLAPSPPTSPAAASTETPVRTVTPTATSSPTASATARPTAIAASSTTPGETLVDTAVVTVVDGVRVRSQPRVSDDSFKYEPLLPLGTPLYVLNGPVAASDYTWYEVVPLTSRTLHGGWVATANRSGEPWLAARDFACPPRPTDIRSLAALLPGVGLACFPRVPITVQARLISCNCDIDGAWYTPSWFSRGGGTSELLVAPDVASPPPNMADWFVLNLDPTGQHPDVLPVGEVVQVTGVFDHPAAASCTYTEMGGEPAASQGCRLQFAVTRLVTARP